MKFENHVASATKVGNIKSNGVSIDAANLDFIITILSSGLYSNPIESFVREIVSNAWDAHVEAGNKDPVILELGKNTEGQHFCKIQDFGVGLSPDRFDKIYRNIGSSTKRDSNEAIGGFGIGRFSALSYSDVVRIISIHDGTEYMYLMYKDNNRLNIDELYSKPSNKQNGVSVELDVKKEDVSKFIEAIKSQLTYFDNLVVIESIEDKPYGIEKDFNNFLIKKYKNFSCTTFGKSNQISLLLGKVSYPLAFNSLKKYYDYDIKYYPIALNFDIGDLPVTPNREQILYNDKSIAKIQEVLDKALSEIEDLVAEQKKKNYTNYKEFKEALSNPNELVLVEDVSTKVALKTNGKNDTKIFNGVAYDCLTFKAHINAFSTINLVNEYYELNYKKKLRYNQHKLSLANTIISPCYFSDVSDLSAHGKAYIREKFDANTYLFKNRKPSVILRNIVKQIKAMSENKIAGYYGPKFKYNSNIVKELIKHYSAFYNKIEVFDNSKIPKQYIIDRKAVARANRSVSTKAKNYWKQNISIGVLKTSWGSYQTTDIDNYKLKDLNTKFKGFSVYSYKGDSRLRSMCSDLPNVTFIEVAPTKMKLLKDLSNFVSLDKFMNEKYKALRNVATVMYIREQIPNLATLYSMKNINRISSRLYNIIKELYEFTSKHGSTVRYEYNISDIEQEIYDFCTEKNAFNEQIKSLYTANEKELIGLDHLRMFVAKRENDLDEITINLATDYVLARKLFRPDVEAVKKLRKETIFNNK